MYYELPNAGRHHLPILHKQVCDKRGIVELIVCEVGYLYESKYLTYLKNILYSSTMGVQACSQDFSKGGYIDIWL